MNYGGFSWKRLLGITAAKQKIGRAVGIPWSRSGRQRKFGSMLGCFIPIIIALLIGLIVSVSSAVVK